MPDYLGQALQGAGAAKSLATGTSPEREANRAQARAGKEAADQKLARLKATKPTASDHENLADIQSLEIKNLKAQQTSMLRDKNEQMTYRSWGRYDETGEVKPLNQMLQDLGDSPLFENISRFDNLTEADSKEIEQANSSVNKDTIINDPTVSRSFVMATMKNGDKEIMNLDDLKGRTRYGKYAKTEELERIKESKQILMLESMGYDASPAGREAFRRARNKVGPDVDPKSPEFQDALTAELDAATARKNRGRSLNETEQEAIVSNRLESMGVHPGDEDYAEIKDRITSEVSRERRATSTQKDIAAARVIADTMESKATQGASAVEEMSDPTQRGKYAYDMSEYKRQVKYKPAESTKKVYRQMRQVIRLGEGAAGMTEESTGVFDSLFHTAKQYITNNVEGVQQTTAFALMNNYAINAMFGATVPVNEEKRANAAFGTNKLQLANVFDRIAVNLETIRGELQDVMATEDPYIAAWDLGLTEDQVGEVLDNLDTSIARLRGKESEARGEVEGGESIGGLTADDITAGMTYTPSEKAILDKTIGGNPQ